MKPDQIKNPFMSMYAASGQKQMERQAEYAVRRIVSYMMYTTGTRFSNRADMIRFINSEVFPKVGGEDHMCEEVRNLAKQDFIATSGVNTRNMIHPICPQTLFGWNRDTNERMKWKPEIFEANKQALLDVFGKFIRDNKKKRSLDNYVFHLIGEVESLTLDSEDLPVETSTAIMHMLHTKTMTPEKNSADWDIIHMMYEFYKVLSKNNKELIQPVTRFTTNVPDMWELFYDTSERSLVDALITALVVENRTHMNSYLTRAVVTNHVTLEKAAFDLLRVKPMKNAQSIQPFKWKRVIETILLSGNSEWIDALTDTLSHAIGTTYTDNEISLSSITGLKYSEMERAIKRKDPVDMATTWVAATICSSPVFSEVMHLLLPAVVVKSHVENGRVSKLMLNKYNASLEELGAEGLNVEDSLPLDKLMLHKSSSRRRYSCGLWSDPNFTAVSLNMDWQGLYV